MQFPGGPGEVLMAKCRFERDERCKRREKLIEDKNAKTRYLEPENVYLAAHQASYNLYQSST